MEHELMKECTEELAAPQHGKECMLVFSAGNQFFWGRSRTFGSMGDLQTPELCLAAQF